MTMSATPTGKMRLLLLEDGHGQADHLRELLRGEDMDLSVASEDFEQALHQVRAVSPDVILIAMGGRSLGEKIERVDAVSGGNPIVALLSAEQVENSRDALLAGARAFLPLNSSHDELVDTVTSVLDRERRRRAALARQLGVEIDLGHIVAVHGAKGGVGATSIAVNLAVALKQATRKRVALVDANLYSGDVAAALNLMSRTSLADLTPNLKDLDEEFLGRASVRHSSGVRAFLAPDDFVRAQAISGEHISRILKVMRQFFDYVVIDTCSLPDQVTSAALEEASRILLVSTPEVPASKNAGRFLRHAGEFGYRDKISLVLNRANSRGALSVRDIEEHLHAQVAVLISSDGRSVPTAVNAGEPVLWNKGSKFSAGIWKLAALVTGVPARSMLHARTDATDTDAGGDVLPPPARQLNLAGEPAVPVASVPVNSVGAVTRSLVTRIRSAR